MTEWKWALRVRAGSSRTPLAWAGLFGGCSRGLGAACLWAGSERVGVWEIQMRQRQRASEAEENWSLPSRRWSWRGDWPSWGRIARGADYYAAGGKRHRGGDGWGSEQLQCGAGVRDLEKSWYRAGAGTWHGWWKRPQGTNTNTRLAYAEHGGLRSPDSLQ